MNAATKKRAGRPKTVHPEFGRRKILTNLEIVEGIMSDLHCSHPTVYSALKYATNTYLSNKIREKALELGGMIIELGGEPATEEKTVEK
ncbi:MAG: hypothetical protein LBH60_04095 [Prevotellaceae bacterium]|jgi:hypothetical protein|nr:hypothetical protein [Prevotellaceae bacterium]